VCTHDKGAVKTMVLSNGPRVTETSNQGNMTSSGVSQLKLIEGRPSHVWCHALGGYPPPVLDLFVGMRDVTGLFFARYVTNKKVKVPDI